MTRLLFIFMDGVGLGEPNPAINPFIRAKMPNLRNILDGNEFAAIESLPIDTKRASLFALDARLGVEGLPQSATGQAALLTGLNIPALIGYHYGPKPNQDVAAYLKNGNLFSVLSKSGLKIALLNAYPPRYFDGIESGLRLPGAIAMAAYRQGIHLMTAEDLYQGKALSADFTGNGWRDHLGFTDAPLLTPHNAGKRLAKLGMHYQFSLFEYWLTDVLGHNQDMTQARNMLETFDEVLGGLFDNWADESGLILFVSDHGNLEDLSTRRHTLNPVPLLLIGASRMRQRFIDFMSNDQNTVIDLTRVYPAILQLLTQKISL